jgi:hypothetical protein
MLSEFFEIDSEVLKVKSNKPSQTKVSIHCCFGHKNTIGQKKVLKSKKRVNNTTATARINNLKMRIEEKLKSAEERRLRGLESRRVGLAMKWKSIVVKRRSVEERYVHAPIPSSTVMTW